MIFPLEGRHDTENMISSRDNRQANITMRRVIQACRNRRTSTHNTARKHINKEPMASIRPMGTHGSNRNTVRGLRGYNRLSPARLHFRS